MADEERDGVIPHFHLKAVFLKKKSEQEGRPIYEDREYCQKLIPGNATEMPDQPVKPEDIERWPDQYQRFKNKQKQAHEGTPLEEWPLMTPSRVSALKDVHIFTVEQLADLPDGQLHNVGPDGQTLKRKARSWLDSAEGSNHQDAIDELKARIGELESENAELRKNQKKKPGRKKKTASKKTASKS